jgi:probable HAF family extracellular repeat protein
MKVQYFHGNLQETESLHMTKEIITAYTFTLLLMITTLSTAFAETQQLKVSSNGRYLVKSDNTPFFWMGDTAWSLFSRLSQNDANAYLQNRVDKGFTTILAGILTWEENIPNYYGNEPFNTHCDLTTPNEAYFQNVDYVIDLANSKGLYIQLAPFIYGDGAYACMTSDSIAYNYGKWLGNRYKDKTNIIWVLGGDVPADGYKRRWRKMARGIAVGVNNGRSADYSKVLMTYHPNGNSSSQWFHNDRWLDFNMIETYSHMDSVYSTVSSDYDLSPAKPTGNGEPAYDEGNYDGVIITAYDARRQGYQSYLAGGYYNYGNDPVYGFGSVGSGWKEAWNSDGAQQMAVMKSIMTSKKWWQLIPDQSIFASGVGSGKDINVAARSSEGDFVFAYFATRSSATINMDKITSSSTVNCKWINTTNGSQQTVGSYSNSGTRSFTVPDGWEDGMLVLESDQFTKYIVTDLGTLGGSNNFASGINNAGQVVGQSQISGSTDYHAYLWSGGVIKDLGTLGGSQSFANAINNKGEVAGYSFLSGNSNYHAFLYKEGVMQDIGSLTGPSGSSYANSINDAGQVVGSSRDSSGHTPAFLYGDGVMRSIGSLGRNDASATAVNAAGQVVGESWTEGYEAIHGFLYDQGSMKDIGTFGGNSSARDINDSGWVVGLSYLSGAAGPRRAILYRDGILHDLQTLGGTESYALGINSSGQIVGGSFITGDSQCHAVLWSQDTMQDLNNLVSLGGDNYLSAARGINDEGQIIAVTNNNRSYLLTPVPIPATVTER